MTDGLKDKYRTAIIEIIAKNPRIERAVLFGSRAMQTFTTASDVDIALFGKELTIDDQSKIMAAIEDLPMPQRVDVLIYDQITNEKLRRSIDQNGIVLYQKTESVFVHDMKWNEIYHGDCIEGMKKIPDESVDLVFADPPFNIGYSYDVYHDRMEGNEYWKWSRSWMAEVQRILKPEGTFWLAIGDEFAAELKVCATRELKFFCRSWIVWYYTFGVNCKYKFTRSHAHLFHFVKNENKFTFNDESIRVPSARQLVYNDKRANPKGRLPDDTWILRPQELEQDFGTDKDTWHVPRVCGTFKEREGWHGCQMPEAILHRIISVSSIPGDKVLDPFLGSGTTVVVAAKLQRQYLGFELSEVYLQQCRNRLDSQIQ